VGVVRKYFGRDNFITIKPECHVIKPMYQEQVLISHKKEISNQEQEDHFYKILKRIRGLLGYVV